MNEPTTEQQVEQRFNLVKALYGDRLDDEQLDEVRRAVEGIVAASEALRAVRLENGDEPLGVFTPLRGEG